jgi:hypothetical protein
MTVITITTVMTITARMTTKRMNSIRESERNWSSFELSSVVVEPPTPSELLLPSETIGRVVDCCLSPSLVLDNVLPTAVVGMLVVEMPSTIVVIVQEFSINGNLRSAA